jgi:lantibiotic modifying enzyme
MRSDEPAFLEMAGRLGRGIAESAIWFEGRCNWVGAVPRDEARMSGRATLTALGPDLYGGTSGVALFLAEAGAALGDDRLRSTALGAIRLALDHADRVDPAVRDGLYDGPIGIAYAAVRIGARLQADHLLVRASETLATWRRHGARARSSDVMSGCAGAVVGLVTLSRSVEEPWLLDAAARAGDELIARADTTGAGWSWATPASRSMHHLCGYAHGAAGIGHALAEVFGATGDDRYREAATRACEYERSWRDVCAGAWPDLRGVAQRAGKDVPLPVANSWCNGAPGIALSRLRAAELLGSRTLRDDAQLAFAACERHADGLLRAMPDDFCLCHGAAGVADVLLHRAAPPGDLPARIGHHGLESFAAPGATFPCGVPLGETPGLLLGFAGIGMLYLRLADPDVPSPLLIGPPRLTLGSGPT